MEFDFERPFGVDSVVVVVAAVPSYFYPQSDCSVGLYRLKAEEPSKNINQDESLAQLTIPPKAAI